jgi:hypothetical protein
VVSRQAARQGQTASQQQYGWTAAGHTGQRCGGGGQSSRCDLGGEERRRGGESSAPEGARGGGAPRPRRKMGAGQGQNWKVDCDLY